MNRSILISTLFAMLSLCGCDRPATVYVPVAVAPVPGPPGPQGATGDQGMMGNQGMTGNRGMQGYQGNDGMPGQPGQPGDGNTVIVMPPAAAEPAK